MTKMLLPMGEMPGVIRESARTVLASHRIALVRVAPDATIEQLARDKIERLLDEVGRNATQSLFVLDEGERIETLRDWARVRIEHCKIEQARTFDPQLEAERVALEQVLKILDGITPRAALFDDEQLDDDADVDALDNRDSDAPRLP